MLDELLPSVRRRLVARREAVLDEDAADLLGPLVPRELAALAVVIPADAVGDVVGPVLDDRVVQDNEKVGLCLGYRISE